MKKNNIRILSLALCMVLICSCFAFAAAPDWKNKEYTKAVEALMDDGIISGYEDGTFRPDNTVTRAEACKIIVATVGPAQADIIAAGNACKFTDMSAAEWAVPFVGYAVQQGIVTGYEDGTFRPSGQVTVAELCAMLVRAKDPDYRVYGGWPHNYINAADILGYLKGTGVDGDKVANTSAPRWMAACLTYNAQEDIAIKNAAPVNPEQSTEGELLVGTFAADFSGFGGYSFAKGVAAYTYGEKADYSAAMKIDKKDRVPSSIYKYKDIQTPAWVLIENNKIVSITVPNGIGFSGKAYGVVNSTVQTKNSAGQAVGTFVSLVGGHEIEWAAKSTTLVMPTLSEIETNISNGAIYEICLTKGEATAWTVNPAAKQGKKFELMKAGTITDTDRKDDTMVAIDGGWYEMKENAAVYVLKKNEDEYVAGDLDDLDEDDLIWLYDISDNKENVADIVVIHEM